MESSVSNVIYDHRYALLPESPNILHGDGEMLSETLQELPIMSGNSKNFAWNAKTTKLLVQQYKAFISAFRDPKVKKKSLWGEIKKAFLVKGYEVSEDILDRKWRNLKKTYTSAKDNINKTGRGRISWEYYEDFQEIYETDRTVHLPPMVTSPIINNRTEKNFTLTEQVNSHDILDMSSSIDVTKVIRDVTPTLTKTQNCPRKSGGYYLKKKHLDIEERRVEEIKLLRLALEKNNAIQAERNEILKLVVNNISK